jgi:RHS repeat-associated protein
MDKQKTFGHKALFEEKATESNAIEIPQITLPKGGGALKGIDEKFKVNSSNGTASFSIPLPLSPNRNGFTPQLSLSYNSGSGNGLFGIGWDLDLPSIQRRTDKKLPRYFDTNDKNSTVQEDSFMFSGVEELVPYLDLKNGEWELKQEETADFVIRQYRPRIEGGFSRIERIFQKSKKSYYWRVTSKENITTFFGYSETCRIADPTDPTDKTKVFQWLPEFAYDDKGSWVWYEYKDENLEDVEKNVHEKNRFDNIAKFSNKHIKQIKYGNAVAKYFDTSPYIPILPQDETHFFDLVFDYGEHNKDNPKINDNGKWLARNDGFSSFRSCFEMRTYRLCRRILMFHTFPNEGIGEERLNNGEATLVRSIDFEYKYSNIYKKTTDLEQKAAELTYLIAIEQSGYVKNGATHSKKSLPKMTFDYQWLQWNKDIKNVKNENLIHAPIGLSGNYQWTDLYNEGINGILTEQANAWYYKSNLGQAQVQNDELGDLNFTHAQPVMPKPSFLGLGNGTLQLQDLEANGQKQIVVNSDGIHGYFELGVEDEWKPFKTFLKNLNLDLKNPNVRMLDVDGDGKPEIVMSDQWAFWWWKNEGKVGYDTPELAIKPYDEERGAAILFSDQEQRIFLADMSGDGLTDIVRIRNGEVCYWANMGYGRFAPKVTMTNSPIFDNPELFNPSYIQLADISGTGATDIIYLGKNKFKAFLNCSGNAWSEPEIIEPFFPTEQPNRISVTDLLGNGTACIVWSSELPASQQAPMRYIDLMGSKKPHIMVSHENGMGKKTEIEYKSSTYFYLKDKLQGSPWITKLPFPVQVVAKSIVTERVTNVRFSSQYTYHHGYYDHPEREFRGFGRVEQIDTEEFEVTDFSNLAINEHHQPPVLTKTWFHTGAFLNKERILTQFRHEYWQEEFKKKGYETNTVEHQLPDAILLVAENITEFSLNQISADEWREALRACKGMTIRQEVFGLDSKKRIADEKQAKNYSDGDLEFINFQNEAIKTELIPYSVATHNCEIQLLQQKDKNHYASFIVKESEAINYTYERNPEDPRITHTLTIETDELGNVLESVSVVYPRRLEEDILKDAPNDSNINSQAKKKARDGQKKQWITFTKNSFTNEIVTPANYYLRKNWQTQTFELTGLKPNDNKPIFSIEDFKNKIDSFAEIEYQQKVTDGVVQKRLIEHIKTKFYNENLTLPLIDGQIASRTIPFESYQLAFTPSLIIDIFDKNLDQVKDDDFEKAKYFKDNDNWWIQSGTIKFNKKGENIDDIKNRFFAPIGYIDQFDSETVVEYDTFNLYMKKSRAIIDKDIAGNPTVFNESEVLEFNFRTLSSKILKDTNDNISSVIVDELGLLKASSIEGKDNNGDNKGEEADNLDGFTESTTDDVLIQQFFNLSKVQFSNVCEYTSNNTDKLEDLAWQLLKNASVRAVYDFTANPTVVASIVREQHSNKLLKSPLQISFEYTDGFGKVAMKKVQAEPGMVKSPNDVQVNTQTQPRWIGNGRTILNNKGNPIKQYEPYFSTSPAYENDPIWVEQGVSPILYYDAVGRNIKTEMPNSTFTKVVFDAWKQLTYDTNDTIEESEWKNVPENAKAYTKSKIHADTPSIIILDSLGRPTLGIDHNKWEDSAGIKEEFYYTHSEIDIEGNAKSITDARGNVVMEWKYDMLGHRVYQKSMDAGRRWMLNDAAGKPIKLWDEKDNEITVTYDKQHRPLNKLLKQAGQANEKLIEEIIYGETANNSKDNNLKGQIFKHRDGSFESTKVKFDFNGNLVETTKQLPDDAKVDVVDWSNPFILSPTIYTLKTEYDALKRPTKVFNWYHQNTVSVNLPKYSKRGALESEILMVNATKTQDGFTGGIEKLVIKDIVQDAKGQRTRVRFGNGTTTCYHYDEKTFRLTQLRTTKVNNEPCEAGRMSNLLDANTLQNLFYTYDPTGNITEIKDDAHEPVFFNNQQVKPESTYKYDALYRLIEATGRENVTFDNAPEAQEENPLSVNFAINNQALRNYTQNYIYDSVGNILKMQHRAGNGDLTTRWTRNYQYDIKSNRLLATEKGTIANYNFYVSVPTLTEEYRYDAHGNMLNVSQSAANLITWDYRDMIQSYDLGGGGNVYYQYSSEKERSRKYIEKNASITEERIYLGGVERYRRWQGNTLKEEIETIHVMDGEHRLLIIENVLSTDNNQLDEGILYRYQYSNHLGSANIELNDTAQIISYEEYHPYGTTAFHAKNADINAAAKRYRYTGMERDEETGLSYHSARFYMPWLGRWCSADPIGVEGGINLYCYVSNSPIIKTDVMGTDEWCGIDDGFFGLVDSSCHIPQIPPISPRVSGGLKLVGGAFETLAGGTATIATSPLCGTGIGCAVPVATGAVTLHGTDTMVSGFRTMLHEETVDSFTSQGLQGLGMTQNQANYADAGIGILGTFGSGTLTRLPNVLALTKTGPLVHLTTANAAAEISATQTLGRGSSTIYAGTPSLADASLPIAMLRTALPASKLTAVIEIAPNASTAFRSPALIGPITSWQRASGAFYSAGNGSINLTTGVFTRTSSSMNQATFYAVDSAFTSAFQLTPVLSQTPK